MPLDDIFHEKDPTSSDAKRLKHFWQWCTIFIGGITTLILLIYDVFGGEDFSFITMVTFITLPAIVIFIWLPPVFIAYLFSKLFAYVIPYYNFSQKEKADIYFYIIISLLFLVYLILYLDANFSNSAGTEWLLEHF